MNTTKNSQSKFRRMVQAAVVGLVVVSTTSGFSQSPGDWFNTEFRITNNSGINDQDIYLSFQVQMPSGAPGQPAQTYGNNQSFSGTDTWQTYNLHEFLNNDIYTFSLNNWSSGKIFITYYDSPTGPPISTYNHPYAVVETTLNGQLSDAPNASVNGNWDASYVNGVYAPVSTYLRNSSGDSIPSTTWNPIITNQNILQNVVNATTGNQGAWIYGTGVYQNQVVGVQAPASTSQGVYHDWTNLIEYWQDAYESDPSNVLRVASYQSPNPIGPDAIPLQEIGLANTLFGYNTTAPISGQAPNMDIGQGYDFSAAFLTDLNPTNDATLTGQGIPQGTQGVLLSGTTTSVNSNPTTPPFLIYLTNASMQTPTGIYGNNPVYTVVPVTPGDFTPYTTSGIMNDLSGRIVGDLMAGMVFGWAGTNKEIQSWATATGLDLYLSGFTFEEVFSSNNLWEISTGEFFYLMSLAGAQVPVVTNQSEATPAFKQLLLDWIGAGIATDSEYYDPFAYEVFKWTASYGTGFGDRFAGFYNPDTTWFNYNPPVNPADPPNLLPVLGYAEIELLPFAGVVPEPSAVGLLLLSSLLLGRKYLNRKS